MLVRSFSDRVVSSVDLVALVTPFALKGKRGRPPFAVETMLRLHFMELRPDHRKELWPLEWPDFLHRRGLPFAAAGRPLFARVARALQDEKNQLMARLSQPSPF